MGVIRKAVFPVGGLGTRFLPATKAIPKEMLPVVDKPLMQYAVEEAYAAGIREMIFVTGRNKRAIEDHFDTAYELEAELEAAGKQALLDVVNAIKPDDMDCFYVRHPRALGLGHWQIIWRHVLPNSMTPVVTFLPFRMSGAILALTSLDFLGLGVPPGTPSLGELLAQGKNNIDAWWISLSTFGVLVVTLLLLTFMGDALRDALDPRKAQT